MARASRKAHARARGFIASLGGALIPINSVLPAISGIAQEGQILTASAGVWTNAPASYTYQWNRDDVPIAGAVNASRTVVTADVGHVLTCTVTAIKGAFSNTITSAATATIIAAVTPVPANTVAPAVTGTNALGQTLSVSTGTWTNAPTSYAYQWRNDGVDIVGATASTYVIAAADQAHGLTCRVYATNTGGTVGALSNVISVPAMAVPTNSTAPVASGTAQEGQVLSVTNGTWTGSPTSYTYQWLRDGTAIAGAVNSTRTLVSADVGHAISCAVTATNAGGSSTAAVSNAITGITAAPTPVPVNSVAPVVSGTGTAGQTLSTTNGTWSNSPTAYAYAWRRDGVDIVGATAATYVVVVADQGHAITCRVYATNAGGTAGATSNAINVGAIAPAASTIKAMPANGKNTITWTDGSNGGSALTSRKIYAANGPAVKTVPANLVATLTTETSYDHTVPNGQLRYYKMVVANTAGNSPASNEDSSQPYVPPTATINVNRAKLQLGLSGVQNDVVSRTYTNLITTLYGQFIDYGNVPTIIDSSIWDAETGALKKMPATGVPQNYLQNPWPYNNGVSKPIRLWCSRPEAVFHLASGAFSNAQALTPKDGGVALDFAFVWPTGADANAWNTNWVAFSIDSLPDGTSDGLGYSEFYAAEIDAIGGNWVSDPRIYTIHQSLIDRVSQFAVVRPMDTRLINQTFSLTTPLTAANRPRFKATQGAGYNGGMVHDASATVTIGGGTVTVGALPCSNGQGLGSVPPGTQVVNRVINFAEPLFNPTTTPDAPYYPYGARANEMGIQFLAPSGASVTYAWNGTTKTLSIKPKAGMKWSELVADWDTRRNSFDNTVNNVAVCLIGLITMSSGLASTVCTATARIPFTGGQTIERQGQMSVEQIVEIAWRSNAKTVWYQIPANADESYIRAEVAYLRDHLPPTCGIEFEFANEVWNQDFGVNAEMKAYGFANNPSGWKQNGTGAAADPYGSNSLLWAWSKFAAEKVTIAKDEWKKTGRTDCRGVFATQAGLGTPSNLDQILTYAHGAVWNTAFEDVAIAPYWTTKTRRRSFGAANVTAWAADYAYAARGTQLSDSSDADELVISYNGSIYFVKDAHTSAAANPPGSAGGAAHYELWTPETYEKYGKDAIDAQAPIIAALKTWATNHGSKRVLAYEGGPGDQDYADAFKPLYTALSHSDVTFRLTKYYLYVFFQNAGSDSIFSQFGDTQPWTGPNPWQWQDYDGAPDAISPKRRAYQDFIVNGATNPYVNGLPAPVVIKSVAINNTGAALTDYQIKVPVAWASGMQANFEDVRFLDGVTPLSYWMDQSTRVVGTSCTFWVKVPSIAVGTKNVTLQYGGATATTSSNGFNVFDFFDDFEAAPTLDSSRWNTSTSAQAWADIESWRYDTPGVVMSGGSFNQGCTGNGTYIWGGKDNGDGVAGSIYKYTYAGALVTAFGSNGMVAGPPHSNSVDIRLDNGNIIACSAGNSATGAGQNVIWELNPTTGAKIAVYETGQNLTMPGHPNACYYGPNQLIVLNYDGTSANYALDVIQIDNTNPDPFSNWSKVKTFYIPSNFPRTQSVLYKDGVFHVVYDDSPLGTYDYGGVRRFSLNADGSTTELDPWRHFPAAEREDIFWDGVNWCYSTHTGSVNRLKVNSTRAATLVSSNQTNRTAMLLGKTSFTGSYAVIYRAFMGGVGPSFGLADALATSPSNLVSLTHTSSSETTLRGRQVNAGTSVTQLYAGSDNYVDYHRYELRKQPSSITYVRDDVVLGTITTGVPNVALSPAMQANTGTDTTGARVGLEYVGVRKLADVEPTITVS